MRRVTTEVVVGPDQPFEVELRVFEEDSWLVMSASNHIRMIREPLEELQASAAKQKALPMGHLEVRGNGAYAIVHDFDLAVPYSPAATDQVLDTLSDYVSERHLRAVAVQALGAVHGAEPPEKAVQRIREISWPDCLERLWIMSPQGVGQRTS